MHPAWAIAIFILQGTVLGIDEFVFHRRRGLPHWERWGHPLDTFSLLLCLMVTVVFPWQQPWTHWYLGLAVFSCLCVTKDEWVHAAECKPTEHWLHALLFLLHPTLLWAVYGLWRESQYGLLRAETALCALFMLYQFFYWNRSWRPTRPA